ncbi:metal ion binding protein [Mycolicibacterium brisbanense]|uniref:Metal ion binding protein n=1 Tax=Mycolicibacterium brisbanense TaxID=146020 RepID=A0A100W6T2_9MYCO|nr:metal ion binding protein [Mycolicibacterium brisbanense]
MHVCGPAFACGAMIVAATIAEAAAITVTRTSLPSQGENETLGLREYYYGQPRKIADCSAIDSVILTY